MGLLDDPNSFNQLGLAFGLLNARMGQNWPMLLTQYAQQQEANRRQSLQEQLLKQQIEGGGLDLTLKKQTVADQLKARDVLADINQQPDAQSTPGVAPMPGGKGTMVTPSVPMPGNVQEPGITGSGKNQTFAYYQTLAQKMMAKGLPDQARQYLDLAEKYRPKLKDTKTLTDPSSGQRVTVNFYEDGSREVVPFGPDQEKAHFADTGGAIAALDPFTGKPIGNAIPKSMTPDAIASNRVAQGNLSLAQQRFAYDQEQGKRPQVVTSPTGEVYSVDPRTATGQNVVGPDGKPLSMGSKLTESQAKASVYYGQMRGASDAANKLIVDGFSPVGKDASNYNQARAASLLTDNHPVIAAALNVMTPAKAQKYQQTAEQWAEAYLRFNTGAATNHSEIMRYSRIFFPMPGDSPEVVAQKNQSRLQAEQMMRIAANNGAQQVEGVMGTGAPVRDDPLGIRK